MSGKREPELREREGQASREREVREESPLKAEEETWER